MLLQILGGELKFAVWIQRNRKKYDRANITAKDIQRSFVNFVRVRVRADFLRLDTVTFSRLWCQLGQSAHGIYREGSADPAL